MKKATIRRMKRLEPATRQDHRGRTRAIASLGRHFDDLYEQLDMQLTRMAHIQLRFDALRSRIRRL